MPTLECPRMRPIYRQALAERQGARGVAVPKMIYAGLAGAIW